MAPAEPAPRPRDDRGEAVKRSSLIAPTFPIIRCLAPLVATDDGQGAAVDRNLKAGGEIRLVGGQEQRGVGDVHGGAHPAQRHPVVHAFRI